ncbi:MAG: hypothetical protein KGI60_02415 [Patescibacteria group bacterium]|nr:hypothetical protein [Patescibacteria group bacterium]
MENHFTKFKTIRPDPAYTARSRGYILSAPQVAREPFSIRTALTRAFQSGAAFGLSAALIFLLASGLSLLNKEVLAPAVLSALDPQSLHSELDNLNIQFKIAQLSYYDTAPQKVAMALNEASANAPASDANKTTSHDTSL